MKIKKCPFCGGKDFSKYGKFVADKKKRDVHVHCHGCGACGPVEGTEQDAVEAWNKRADGWVHVDDALPEEGKAYLCQIEIQGDLGLERWMEVAYFVEDEKEFHRHDFKDNVGIIAWRPLPEAY